MDIKFYVPSYKRPNDVLTQNIYPFVNVVVMESEREAYEKGGVKNLITCPDEVQGNLCRVMNWILDNYLDKSDGLVILDDDGSGIGRWENQVWEKFEAEELVEFCEEMAIVCKEWGFGFWGLNCITDKGAYREHTPFGTLQYIGGPFRGWLRGNDLRYDERLSLKDDYDMTLQQARKYGGCLRVNFASYRNLQSEQEGGCSAYRNMKEEKRQFDLLEDKWGSDVVRLDRSSKKKFDYNPIIKVPFRGV